MEALANKTVLIADDEQHILELVTYNLEQSGFAVITARNGAEALCLAQLRRPDLIILDMQMPVYAGDVVCRELRKAYETMVTPIIMLSLLNDEDDMVLAFESGADDFVTKPFSVRELTARVRALLRRACAPNMDKSIIVSGDLRIDTVNYEVERNGVPMTLTLREFELLRALVEAENKVLTRKYLLNNIWGYDYFGETRTVDVHIRHLRRKLGDYAECIITVRNIGYKYVRPGSE